MGERTVFALTGLNEYQNGDQHATLIILPLMLNLPNVWVRVFDIAVTRAVSVRYV